MKRIFLITLATTISTLAAENSNKRGNPEKHTQASAMTAGYDNGSSKQRKTLPMPNMEAVSYTVQFLDRFNEDTFIDPKIGILDMSKVQTLSLEDIELLGHRLPDLKVLYINGDNILGSYMELYIKAFAENLPSLRTLGIGFVRSIPASRVEAYAQQYSWNAHISRTSPVK